MTDKVLIIDNELLVAEMYGLILMLSGWEVVVVGDSQVGVELIHTESPGVVLLDTLTPAKSGIEVCCEIRAFSNVPIAMISVVGDCASIAAALDAGADDYLVKPVSSGELLARLNSLTRRMTVTEDCNKFLMDSDHLRWDSEPSG